MNLKPSDFLFKFVIKILISYLFGHLKYRNYPLLVWTINDLEISLRKGFCFATSTSLITFSTEIFYFYLLYLKCIHRFSRANLGYDPSIARLNLKFPTKVITIYIFLLLLFFLWNPRWRIRVRHLGFERREIPTGVFVNLIFQMLLVKVASRKFFGKQ